MRMISPWEYNYNDRCEAARLKLLIVTLPVEIIAFIQRNEVIELLSISNPTAGNMLDSFCEDGIQVDLAPQKSRNKLYVLQNMLQYTQ